MGDIVSESTGDFISVRLGDFVGIRTQRNAAAPGAVNLVAGLIRLASGAPSFFKEDDPRASYADILAIIRGSHHDISVVLGHQETTRSALPCRLGTRTPS